MFHFQIVKKLLRIIYIRIIFKPIVQWRMKPPELKPLVTKSKAPETADLIRKATKAVAFSPIKTLSEFQG